MMNVRMIFLIALSGRVNFESLEKKILAISITLKGLLNKFFVSFKKFNLQGENLQMHWDLFAKKMVFNLKEEH